ncbi:hypothetical protein CC1G_10020 [Coprinopsis cinerea okayama7|uniref:Uncharacterized protein n=1 Tax=Coprinopsis cinerea (strain Okayama-7 / 130 / ATCC MYA-4618 / FGSC 9003) TaxID=240176 RepID=A8NDM1_COPC7|nr:hypothetical protein CC1G_10020 [Coprinopsis cinerea okayama7\|eukprot:XP_001832806.1 hypothetical protein CC1G_10020 [Coprinopsis cinerea okayama7\
MKPAVDVYREVTSGSPTTTSPIDNPRQTSQTGPGASQKPAVHLGASSSAVAIGEDAENVIEGEGDEEDEEEDECPLTESAFPGVDEVEATLERVGLEDIAFDMDVEEVEVEVDEVEEGLEGISLEDVLAS